MRHPGRGGNRRPQLAADRSDSLVSGPTTRNRTPSLWGDGVLQCPARRGGARVASVRRYDPSVMKPRPRDWIGAAILVIVLVVLVVFVVSLGAQGT
jgi:hypothetical protein